MGGTLSADNDGNLARRVGLLEDKDQYNDKRMRNIENSMKQDKKELNDSIKELHGSLKLIEKGQHTQEITNVKMNYTLDSINSERQAELENKKENKKDIKQIKVIVITAAVSFAFTLIMAFIQQFLF